MLRSLKTPANVPATNRNIQDDVANAATRPAVPVLQQQPAVLDSHPVVQMVLEKELSTDKLYSIAPDTSKRYCYSRKLAGKWLFYELDDMGQNEIELTDLNVVSETTTKHLKDVESDDDAPTKKKKKTPPPVETDFVKKSFSPSGADAAIPDLPADKVKDWSIAIQQNDQRQRVLDEMFQYVKAMKLFEAWSGNETLESAAVAYQKAESIIKVVYKDSIPNVAAAEYDRPDGTTGLFTRADMIFGPSAFGSLARLYSTFRHEMIHLGQLLLEPDDKTDATDPLLFELHIDWIEKKSTNKTVIDLLKKLQESIKEVETHIWELENAGRTGIISDKDYIGITYDWLHIYLCNIRNDLKTLKHKGAHKGLKGYLVKVGAMVGAFVKGPPVIGATEKLTLSFVGKSEKEARDMLVAVVKEFRILK